MGDLNTVCVMIDPRTSGVIIPENTVESGFCIRVRDFERIFYFGTKIESASFLPLENS